MRRPTGARMRAPDSVLENARSMRVLVRKAGGWPLLALAAGTATLDAAASLIRNAHLQSGLDLALFDQAVWHYSHFQAPYSSIKGTDLLGDHFHPLVALLAPLYWIWSDPRTLLIAQAVLVAASIVPVFLFAESRLGRAGAYLLSGAYAAFWGIQVGVLFDFHEVAFAPLLIALAVLLADRRRWGWFWLVIALLLCVKEDLSIFVLFFGLYLLLGREFRHGIALVVVGIAWYELVTGVFMPDISGGPYLYWTYGQLGHNLPSAVWGIVTGPWRIFTIGFSPVQKARTMLALLAPFLFLSLGSRVFILALPLLAERFFSTNVDFWSTHFHYSLALSPVLAMGVADALANASRLLDEQRRRLLLIGGPAAMLPASVAITLAGTSHAALSEMTRPSFYRAPPYVAGAYAALRQVPANAPLATDDIVLPHASHRDGIKLIGPQSLGVEPYLVTNVALLLGSPGGFPTRSAYGQQLNIALSEMTPIYYDPSGWIVMRRPPPGQRPSNGVMTPLAPTTARLIQRQITMLSSSYVNLLDCSRLWQAKDPRTASCFLAAQERYQSRDRELVGTVAAILPDLHGGCAQLAAVTVNVASTLASAAAVLGAAGASPDRHALPAATAEIRAQDSGLDLTGRLVRLLVLCSPRRST